MTVDDIRKDITIVGDDVKERHIDTATGKCVKEIWRSANEDDKLDADRWSEDDL
jgi:hypothetical protein